MDNEVLCVGDATIDAFLTIHEASLHCRLNDEARELRIRYGEKIPVESCCFLLGGIACNVAVGLKRLGITASLVAEIGDDEFSQKILRTLEREGVHTSFLIQTSGAAASFAVAINFAGERTLFVEHVRRDHNFSFHHTQAEWVFLGGLGQEWKGAYQKTVEFVKNENLRLAFTPGSQQFTEGRENFIDTLAATHALFVNLQEAARIMNQESFDKAQDKSGIRGEGRSAEFVKESLKEIQAMGPRVVSITDGKNGSFAIDEEGTMYTMRMFPGEAIEKTGAGDAYTSGMLGALVLGLPVPEAMRFGAVNAASVVAKIGAQEGLLDREEIEKRLVEHSDFQAKVM